MYWREIPHFETHRHGESRFVLRCGWFSQGLQQLQLHSLKAHGQRTGRRWHFLIFMDIDALIHFHSWLFKDIMVNGYQVVTAVDINKWNHVFFFLNPHVCWNRWHQGMTVQEMCVCVSAPVVRGISARKRENGQQNAKTRKRDNAKTRKRARKYENAKAGQLWSSPDLAARECKIIILRCNSGVDLCCAGTSSTE